MNGCTWFPDSEITGEIGGKATALLAATRHGLPVPPWFVVLPLAFADSLDDDRRRRLASTPPEELVAWCDGMSVATPVQHELALALARLDPAGGPVAVRSSGLEEDGLTTSYAGQFESFLDVSPDAVAATLPAVWCSGYSNRLGHYQEARGTAKVVRVPAVVVQRMVRAAAAGVAFSADPVSGRRGAAVVAAVAGLGDRLVSGEEAGVTWTVADGGLVERRDDSALEAVLDDDGVRAVAELARCCADLFGRPQDIEWAFEGETLWLLQSRPITTLATLPDPDGRPVVWDNANIAESYHGITSPLTFSFARRAYREVYLQLCRLLGVDRRTILAHHGVFDCMLGLFRGRVYYNLASWYRLLALLPGFRLNRRFMEQMMGVAETLPSGLLEGTRFRNSMVVDGWRVVRLAAGLIAAHVTLPARVRAFHRRVDRVLGSGREPLARLRSDQLVSRYRELERRLLSRWQAPLVNDLLTMIWCGVARRAVAAWCGDDGLAHYAALLADGDGMISREPAQRIDVMAREIADDPESVAVLCDGSIAAIAARLATRPLLAGMLADYLERFGERCIDELKLESETLADDPLPLYRAVGMRARQWVGGVPSPLDDTAARRAESTRRLAGLLVGRPLRRRLLFRLLEVARRRVRDRENLRFERTRAFGRVRSIVVELGRRLAADGQLDHPREVFWLELEELLAFVEGTATTTDLRALVALRQRQWREYRDLPVPADRFVTRGVPYLGHDFAAASPAPGLADSDRQDGLGCCPGVVRGPVRVIRDPRGATLGSGEIIVAERTDPGWVLLFPAAAGLLVERGSLLSHAAIVARELGLPTVVGLAGLTGWLRDGDWVELDGGRGTVRRVAGAV